VWLVLWSGEHEKPNWGILELEYTVERKSRLRLFIKNWICTLGLCEQFCHTCNGFFLHEPCDHHLHRSCNTFRL
jgi:hypothetical protein